MKLVHLFGFIIRIYHDARSPERQIRRIPCVFLAFREHRCAIYVFFWFCFMFFMVFADDIVFEMCCIAHISEIPTAFIPKPKM